MGLEVHCFAWDKNAVCKEYCDEFHPISIFETDRIIDICRDLGVAGVVSNASEETALASAIVAEALGLNGTSSVAIRNIQNKRFVRMATCGVDSLSTPAVFDCKSISEIVFPCVVKPAKGSAKKGVSFCNSPESLTEALSYAGCSDSDCFAEEYIEGDEYSVETISYHGCHHIIQITEKKTTGFPHFVELEHHQPARLSDRMRQKVEMAVSDILTAVEFTDGASHTEIKINGDRLYLIEVNPRGGGDRIADTLTSLSTDCDFLKSMILVAIDRYSYTPVSNVAFSGILFLNKYTKRLLPYFSCKQEDWMVERFRDYEQLHESMSNYDRNGFIIYKANSPIHL